MEDEESNEWENESSHENEEYVLFSGDDWDLNPKQAHHFEEDLADFFSRIVSWVTKRWKDNGRQFFAFVNHRVFSVVVFAAGFY